MNTDGHDRPTIPDHEADALAWAMLVDLLGPGLHADRAPERPAAPPAGHTGRRHEGEGGR
ncbi:hypothetical protein RKE30_13195 [Streptomyces sp. Li-HN-5-11]|uniref:hypothetical protein n=1 Tax=Streptomyces sp. Li-HN-5-11 TaxID=3075432 RepID=UPI0028AD7D6A|nr:hypothetical protein [Streptomyces sp. Li-HN-5-11]WNM31295.1 hypothetical protein RKE30_13195 [Streptomyces sp. Li-HN-5-11]